MIKSARSVLFLLGLLPLVGAVLMFAALGLPDTVADFPVARGLFLTLWGLTSFTVGWAAYRRGASRWSSMWGLAGAIATVAFFLGIVLVELEDVQEGDGAGCPAARIYC